jgi:hypothetical protein
MSGVCGIGQRHASAQSLRPAIAALLADLSDFGSAAQTWVGPPVALGQRQERIYRRDRLERQPVRSADQVLVADARLIDFEEIAGALDIPASAFVIPAMPARRWMA